MENINSWKDLRVLVVDDSNTVRQIICGMLRKIGVIHIFEAEDGLKALKFKSTDLDLVHLIICDWNMPSVSGIEVLKYVRTFSSAQAFLMVTTRCDPLSIIQAREAGVDGYIRKPFSAAEFKDKIATILIQKLSLQNQLAAQK